MRTRSKLVGILAAAALAAVGVVSPSSAASAPTTLEARITAEAKTAGLSAQEVTELQGKVDAELKRAPAGAKQISLNQIAYRDGAVITLTLPGEKRARAVAGTPNCPYGSACLWEHANFEGTRFERSLPCHTWIDLGAFRDRASSYQDNQTAAAYHVTYNDGQGVLWSTQNTNGLSSYVGDSRNDRADWIMLTGAC
ncbi:peptidase inhibitor family I36 protein [Streptomyces sp. NPDC095602]|uniref:peptidase inhibitor family I36 protein n=1 Tax=Streptomyces sp. NPDC095602 TaxID=3155819 RepID=UPI003321324E